MASLAVLINYQITLNAHELSLVLKALGGRLPSDESHDAQNLCNELSRMKAANVNSMLRQNDKLLENI